MTSRAELLRGLETAAPGDTLYIDEHAVIDLGAEQVIQIPAHVTLATNRAEATGGILLNTSTQARPRLQALGPGVVLRGLELRGVALATDLDACAAGQTDPAVSCRIELDDCTIEAEAPGAEETGSTLDWAAQRELSSSTLFDATLPTLASGLEAPDDDSISLSTPDAASLMPEDALQELDVTLFGARGDDQVDDTDAIQAAIDEAKRLGGGIIRLPAGEFFVSDQDPVDSIALKIHGARNLVFVGHDEDTTKLTLASPRDSHVLAIADSQDVSIRQLTIDGRRTKHESGHGVRVGNSERVLLRRLKIGSVASYGIGLQQGSLRDIVIEDVAIDDTGSDGIDFKNRANSNTALVLNNIRVTRHGQTRTQQAGVDIRGPATLSNIRVSDFADSPGGVGIRFRPDGVVNGFGGHDSVLTDFVVLASEGHDGVVVEANRVTLTSGSVSDASTGVLVYGSNAHLTDVFAQQASLYGFHLRDTASGGSLVDCTAENSTVGLAVDSTDVTLEHAEFDSVELSVGE